MNGVPSSGRGQLLFRLLTIVCAILISWCILFDVLDLDGSNWPLVKANATFAIVTETTEIKPAPLAVTLKGWGLTYHDFSSHREILISFLVASETRISGLKSSRSRSYRVTLPRSSTADPLLLA
jgi:hypothetical protein